MTQEQKEQTISMRKNGSSYSEIAQFLKISRNTVKSFCQRTGFSVISEQNESSETECRECGKPITQITGRKKILFCCGECRQKWWNAHPEAVNRKAIYTFTCVHCGKEFTAYGNNHRKYCSHECYVKDRFKH
ncbi:MAG: RNA polymerase subunit sigma-70 [Oscillospiraceae bacterium]|nr:RNA polymerase subunit sigma-70 [Oscillospiraceae bacterium]